MPNVDAVLPRVVGPNYSRRRWLGRWRLSLLLGLLAAGLVLGEMFIGGPIGLADNGDGRRLTCPLEVIAAPPPGVPKTFDYAIFRYEPYHWPAQYCGQLRTTDRYLSSQTLLLLLTKALTPLGGAGALDLRVLAVVCALGFGAAIGLLGYVLPGGPVFRVTVAGAVAVLTADVAFASYFASAYSEPAGLLASLFVVGGLLWCWRSRRPRPLPLLLTSVAGAALVLDKSQTGLVVVPLAVALLVRRVPLGRWRGRWSGRLLPAACAAALIVLTIGYLHLQPEVLRRTNMYNAVFGTILGHSPDPTADLRQLGLDPALSRYAGTSYFQPHNAISSPAYAQLVRTIGYPAIGRFYATHLDRTVALADRGARAAFQLRPSYLGNLPWAPARRGAQVCRVCILSTVVPRAAGIAPVLLPVVWLVALAFGGRLSCRRYPVAWRTLGGATIFLVVTALLEFLAVLFGEGDYEMVKHMAFADLSTTMASVFALACVAGTWQLRRRGAGWSAPAAATERPPAADITKDQAQRARKSSRPRPGQAGFTADA